METKDLAKKLKELRAVRGMSQEYLADESRVSLRTIQRIENNESEPTGETIKRIANALDVELTELIGPNSVTETSDLKATIIFLKKKLSKTIESSEIKTFENFIALLQKLKEKDLNPQQIEAIESYIQYLELEKVPSFSNELFKQKLSKFGKYLKNKLHFVPNNYYTTRTAGFALAFAFGFVVQANIDYTIKIGVFSAALLIIGIGVFMDLRIKKQERSF
ncbi:helix-turn-helix domain-containing protein [Leptobacterium flavescens]|uniref:Helix-turn-helix domain-containing protein n=1 Tax=Leptobacterium flavescens TaxID=472055 RepID=A0A6P0UQ49_9FLAO|nr:helix-turn-helix transcriptional regulator [Leptobacterium flavescens]NER15087.1 helix-turn-helix domain-containing protein [Leptobacterium flavescens]